MAITPGQRFVRRHNAARSSTSNTTAADISYDTAVISEGGYSWSSPEVTVDEAGLYLTIFDIGQANLASTRAVGTLVPSINTTDQARFRATHRYLRNSGGNHGASIGMAILDLAASDDVKVRNPGALTPTDAVGNYATNSGSGGGLQLIRLPANDFTHVERTADAAEVGQSNINTTRPWLDSSGTWTKITYNSEVNDDAGLYSGSGGDITLAANTKYMIVWGCTPYSADSSRHTYIARLSIDGDNVQSGSGYQRNTASQGPPICGMYLHETGGSAETAFIEATHEIEGGDAGTPNIADAYFQVIELPSSAEWIHVDNGATDSLTTALVDGGAWYDTPLSSTLRSDGDSNLSLDGGNDAVQNDSGGSLPILAIGWHRWDRDAGTSGIRKMPWSRWDNGGSALGYGVAGAFSRGQQGSDDTFQAHFCSAATMDLADAADLSFQVNEPATGTQGDMGIYASTSRYFLGVQVLNLDTLVAAGGEDALLAEDVESASAVGTPSLGHGYTLTSTDVESASNVGTPAVGQGHALNAADVQSVSSVGTPAVTPEPRVWLNTGQTKAGATEMTVTAFNLAGTSITFDDPGGAPTGSLFLGVENTGSDEIGWIPVTVNGGADVLTAEDVESASQVSTPAIGQGYTLTSTDVDSSSETGVPTLGQTHDLTVSSVESASEVSNPVLAESSHTLGAEDVQSASEVSSPAVGQAHALTTSDVQSASEVSSPVASEGSHALLANDVESATEAGSPAAGQTHVLAAGDIESASEVATPTAGQAHALLSAGVQSSSEVGSPAAGQAHTLLADNVESATEVSTPLLGEAVSLNAAGIESASEVTSTALMHNPRVWLNTSPTKTGATELTVTSFNPAGTSITFDDPFGSPTGSVFLGVENTRLNEIGWIAVTVNIVADHNLSANDLESTSEVTSPAVGQAHTALADDAESASEVSTPSLVNVHDFTGSDAGSESEVSSPGLTEAASGLLAEDVESASEVTAPAVGQAHALTSVDAESASEVTTPNVAEDSHSLLADDVESATEVASPQLAQVHDLFAASVESASEVTNPSFGGETALLADDVESTAEVTSTQLAQVHYLFADDVESSTQTEAPSLGQQHDLLANDVESASEVSLPKAFTGVSQRDVICVDFRDRLIRTEARETRVDVGATERRLRVGERPRQFSVSARCRRTK